CVAAASIVAKVTRDRLMASLDEEFPQYGFADHKGYVTPQHRLALETYGPCPHHRYSFVTVARGMGENELGAGVAWSGTPADRYDRRTAMSAEDVEKYETEVELQLYREYRDVVGLFTYVVETERRFYLTNSVDLDVRTAENGDVFFDVKMQDAWVWDMYRPARFVKNVRVVTFKDVNVEELAKADLEMPKEGFSS